MDAKMTPQKPFLLNDKKEVVDYIRSWVEQNGRFRLDPHLKIDRDFRQVSIRDCKYVLSTATVDSLQWPPEWDEKHQNHVLHINSFDLDGEPVEMLFVIDFENFTIRVFNWLS